MPVTDPVPELKESIKEAEKAIRGGGTYTLQDVSTKTGLAMEEARRAMDELLKKYRAGITLSMEGVLVYDFGNSLTRRGEKTSQERWEEFKEKAWEAFKVFYKIWIAVTLVVYFVLFVIILIGLIFASSASSSDRDNRRSDSSPVGGLLYLVLDMFRSIFIWRTIMGPSRWHYETDRYGYRYRHYDYRKDPLSSKENKKGFVAAVYDFVFGPDRIKSHGLANQREAAAFLRKEKGIVTLSELKALAGWSAKEAEEFMGDILSRFNGQAVITDDGVLIGDFEELLYSEGVDEGVIEWYWEEYEAPYELTGNTKSRNTLIGFMNLFNLTFAILFISGYFNPLLFSFFGSNITGGLIGLGYIPFLFSLIFFAVPIIRYFDIQKKEERRHLNNIRKRLFKDIWFDSDKIVPKSQLLEAANSSKSLEKLSEKQVDEAMKEIVLDYNAHLEVSDQGEAIYVFDQLKRELETAEKMRRNRGNLERGSVMIDLND